MTSPNPSPAADELVEYVAAAFHTLTRSWRYVDAAGGTGWKRPGPAELAPWVEQTDDASWVARGSASVDLANTAWEELPSDWRARFIQAASDAASAVVEAVEAGQSLQELDEDETFVERTGRRLARAWLGPPGAGASRVVPSDEQEADQLLARTAIHVYAARLANFGGLGTVPTFPPPDFSDPERFVLVEAGGQHDGKRASFRVTGEALDPTAVTTATGIQPSLAYRRGDLRVVRPGSPLSPYHTGMWNIQTDGAVEQVGPTLEDHLCWLLDALEPHVAEIVRLSRELDLRTDFFCGYWQRRWNSAWDLSATTLGRIAALGASLSYDAYIDYDREDDEDASSQDDPTDAGPSTT